MLVSELVKGLRGVRLCNCNDLEIYGLSHNSREIKEGDLFFCIKGQSINGENFAKDVVKRGAICIVAESELDVLCPQVIVKDCRQAMSIIAGNFYGNCHKNLEIISLIGTNGKTTTSYIIGNILKENGYKIAIIGTNGAVIDNNHLEIDFTTPDPIILHHLFLQIYNMGVKYVIMEVSAHAIALNKMEGIFSRIGVFSNITPEHLDFFKTFSEYCRTKINYFNSKTMKECVVNSDCPFGQVIARHCDIPCLTYGLENPANSFGINIESNLQGINFFANIIDDTFEVETSLIGDINIYNILSAMTVCKLLGISSEVMQRALKKMSAVDGRFNIIKLDDNKLVIIDFAHTPDGFEKLLSFVRKNVSGKIISLFGCVGYSDIEKRSEMAQTAEKYSDYIIVSSDNPGKTKFSEIIKGIEEGFSKSFKSYSLIEDRWQAVKFGLQKMESGDTLVLMGKGAETSQNINGIKVPYNEMQTVKELLNENETNRKSARGD